MNNLLYIGLHGYAGSGKDTVAKALRLLLSYDWKSFDEFKTVWEKEAFKRLYATFENDTFYGNATLEDTKVYCIAFADQLKHICAEMFGIPVKHFYYNKETSWINISGTFEYTEKLPYGASVITAEDYYRMMNSYEKQTCDYWMSLREVLVYVGTYICQSFINKDIFTNGVNNKIKMVAARNKNLQYIICTDVRFYHEIEFIKKHSGINIDIIRPEVKQLDNVAEHDLDDEDNFDLTIYNDSTYDDLLHRLWDVVHENIIFKNETYSLMGSAKNYLRRIAENQWQSYFELGTDRVSWEAGDIVSIMPTGGTLLQVGQELPVGMIKSIMFDEELASHIFII